MIKIGEYNTLKVLRKVEFGVYLDDGAEGILLPKRFVPRNIQAGDEVKVFVYHDSDNRMIATTQQPKGCVGDIVVMKAVAVTHQGAFLDWGLMKDLFVAKSQQLSAMHVGGNYLVTIYIDQQTGRAAATEKISTQLSNENLTVKELDEVDLIVYRRSDIGYVVIINGLHTGMLYFDQVFKDLQPGDKLKGFIKTIRPDNKIDVIAGKRGYEKVEGETEKILRLLKQNNGFLPYHDKSAPEEVYSFFGMSKKTFKMSLGKLFKEHLINITDKGIEAVK